MAKQTNMVVRTATETKTDFKDVAEQYFGDMSTLVSALMAAAIRRAPEDTFRYCYGNEPVAPQSSLSRPLALKSRKPAPTGSKSKAVPLVRPGLTSPNAVPSNMDSSNSKGSPAFFLPPAEVEQLMSTLGNFVLPTGENLFVAGTVHGGPWREITNEPSDEYGEMRNVLEMVNWNRNRDLVLYLTANEEDGECLIGDGIYPGDALIFRTDWEPVEDDIVLVIGETEDGRHFATVKHWYDMGDVIELRSSNPKCPTIVVRHDKVRVHGVMRTFIAPDWSKRRRGKALVPVAAGRPVESTPAAFNRSAATVEEKQPRKKTASKKTAPQKTEPRTRRKSGS